MDRATRASRNRSPTVGRGWSFWAALFIAFTVSTSTVLNIALEGTTGDWGVLVGLTSVGLIGAFLVARKPGHAVSWTLVGAGLVGSAAGLSAALAPHPSPDVMTVWEGLLMALGQLSWFGFLTLLLGFLPLLFPTGRVPTPRWRWLLWLGIVVGGTVTFLAAFQEQFCVESSGGSQCLRWVDNPFGIPGVPNVEFSELGAPVMGALLAFILLSIASLVFRFIRSRGVERQQLKWFAFTFVTFVAYLVSAELLATRGIDITDWPLISTINELLWVAIPGSAAVAILRYRLYEIDRIISRTLSYTVVAGLLGLVFLGVVTGITTLLPAQSSLAVAASTLAVAGLFTPLRRRIQDLVDRRFNRSRYDVQKTLEAFSGRLRVESDLTAVHHALVAAAERSFHPSQSAIWLAARNDPGTLDSYHMAGR